MVKPAVVRDMDDFDVFMEQIRKENAVMDNTDRNTNTGVVYGSGSFDFFLFETYLAEKNKAQISTFKYVDKKVWIRQEVIEELVGKLCADFGMHSVNHNRIVLRNADSFVMFQMANNDIDNIEIVSTDAQKAKEIEDAIDPFICDDKKVSIKWLYSPDGRSMDLIEDYEENTAQDLYPYISNYDTFADRFFASKSNILLLIGEPGTGKTTFIKHLIAHMNKQTYLTYDEKVLANDYTFASYMEDDDAGAFVIEDADLFLRSRKDGNGMVSRFLNVGDGLIKLQNKKLIFSTNLPNISDIDSALIRPGRCFEIISFRALTRTEAQTVADNRNLILPGPADKQSYTLAEVFNGAVEKPKAVSRGFGFLG